MVTLFSTVNIAKPAMKQMTLLSLNRGTSAVKLKAETCCLTLSVFIIQKMMALSLEIPFKHKVAINLYISFYFT